jgi:hypothetical protein
VPLACDILVSGGHDPTDEYSSMFIIELKPKGFDFHNSVAEEDFQISQVAGSVAELREYLAEGKDVFDGKETWVCIGTDEEEAKFVKPLPAPFNDVDAYVNLCWVAADIVYDEAAALLCDLYDKAFTELELQRLDVGELTVIRAVKGAKSCGSRKPELVDAILAQQKSVGQKAVRVVQKSLFGNLNEKEIVA